MPARAADAERRLQTAPVVAERDALVADLNWQGLLGPGAAGLKRGPGDDVLLWQAEAPLAWLRPGEPATRQLVLNLDWTAGNAARLPAMVVLLILVPAELWYDWIVKIWKLYQLSSNWLHQSNIKPLMIALQFNCMPRASRTSHASTGRSSNALRAT